METIEVSAGHGRAFNIVKGSRFRLTTPQGQQSADFFAFCADDISEGLSPHHTWMPTRSLHPRVGDPMLSRKRRPMVELVEDGAAVAEITHVAGARVVLDNVFATLRTWLRDDSGNQEMTREWLARRLARADALMARLWPPETL